MNRKITTQMKRMMLMAFIFSNSLATFAIDWSTGTYTLNSGTITDNFNLSGDVTIYVPSGTVEIRGVISGAGFKKTGKGDLILSGNNTNIGRGNVSIVIAEGRVMLGFGGQTGSVPGDIEVQKNAWLIFYRSGNYINSNRITGEGGVIKYSGNWNLTIAGNNTYTGPTHVYGGGGGYLNLSSTSSISSSSGLFLEDNEAKVVVSGECHIKSLNSSFANAEINLSSSIYTYLVIGTLGGTDGGGVYAGKFTGPGGIDKRGSGKLTLSNTSTGQYSGNTVIVEGTLVFSANSLGTGKISFDTHKDASLPGTLSWAETNTTDISGRLGTLGRAPIFEINGSPVTFANALPREFIKTGKGVLNITRTHTYTGTTEIREGYLVLTDLGSIAGPIAISKGASLYFDRAGADFIHPGVISGEGSITKFNANKLTLTANNTHTGRLWVYKGTVQVGNGTSGSIQSSVDLDAGTVLRFEPAASTTVLAQAITGAGKVQYKGKADNHSLRLTATNTYSGGTEVELGEFTVGNNTDTGSIVGNVSLSAGSITDCALIFRRSNNYVFTGTTSGDGYMRKYGAGKLTLSGNLNHNGTTEVHEGILQIGNGTSGSINNSDIILYNSTTLRFEPGGDMTFSRRISDAGASKGGKVEYKGKNASSKLIFTDIHNYSGLTTIESGSLYFTSPFGAIKGNILSNGSLHFQLDNARPFTFPGVLSGMGDIYIDSGVITFEKAHPYVGSTNIANGTLILNGTSSIDNSSAVNLTSNDAKLDLSAGAKTIKSLNTTGFYGLAEVIIGEYSLSVGEGYYSGKITGTGGLIKTGTGKLTFYGHNTNHTGNTIIQDGTLQVGDGTVNTALSTSSVTVSSSSSTLRFEQSGDQNIDFPISGAGSVEIKTGVYKFFNLRATNTYFGSTKVEQGDLWLSATGSIENSNMVYLTGSKSALIIWGDKKIKGLIVDDPDAEVILNKYDLSVYEGSCKGKITGTGGFILTGGNFTFNCGNGGETYTGGTLVQGGTLTLTNMGYNSTALEGGLSTSGIHLSSPASVLRLEAVRTMVNPKINYPISGAGSVEINTVRYAITFDAANSYFGATTVESGNLRLSPTGSIENSSGVLLYGNSSKLTILGDKKIKGLIAGDPAAQVVLNNHTLTIAGSVFSPSPTSPLRVAGYGQDADVFSGSFEGTGNVVKQGNNTFFLNGDNTTTGSFTVAEGEVILAKKWQGNFIKKAGAKLSIDENAVIGGTLTLDGGSGVVDMDLTGAKPSKITVGGAFATSGILHINISPPVVPNNQVLIEAASGINAANFTVTNTGYPSMLTATPGGKQLLLAPRPSAIDELHLPGLAISPNPFTTSVVIENAQGCRLKMLTVDGLVVGTHEIVSNKQEISTTDLPQGVYLFYFLKDDAVVVRKVVRR